MWPCVLKCARIRSSTIAATEMDVGRGDVDPELHPQRPPELQFRLEPALRKDVDGVPRQVRAGHRWATLAGALALLRKRNRPPKRRRIRKLRLLALLSVLGLLGLAAFTFGLLTAIAAQIPALDPNRPQKTEQTNTYVYASDGHTILAILRGSQARIVVPSEDISPWLKHAIVAIEDKRFYEHRGVDVRGIARAVWADVTNGGTVQGGSTITSSSSRTRSTATRPRSARKLREAALAWRLEQEWTKDQILTAYLNTIYFGNGAYGVEQACRVYFGHSADTAHVNPAEAALLAGIPEDPSLYDPVAHPKLARARRNLVLRQMYLQHYLDAGQYRRVRQLEDAGSPFGPAPVEPESGGAVLRELRHRPARLEVPAAEVYGAGLPGHDDDRPRPPEARAGRDREGAAAVDRADGRARHDRRSHRRRARDGRRPQLPPEPVQPRDAGSERQPGSSFKPFVLAAALRAGISPATTIVSHKVTIDAGGRVWNVNNFEGEYLGPIDLIKAIAASDNSVFAQLTNIVGPSTVARTAAALGITTPLQPYFAIGLGAEPATPLEMARAYAAFADGGYRLDNSMFGNAPLAIKSITDAHGTPRNNHTKLTAVPGFVGNNAAIEDELLQGVVSSGTGTAAQLPGWTVAGKTGTTENYGDAWFVGFTPDLVTAVWVGYPDRLVPMLTEFHGRAVAGGTYPALIWKAFMQKALRTGSS